MPSQCYHRIYGSRGGRGTVALSPGTSLRSEAGSCKEDAVAIWDLHRSSTAHRGKSVPYFLAIRRRAFTSKEVNTICTWSTTFPLLPTTYVNCLKNAYISSGVNDFATPLVVGAEACPPSKVIHVTGKAFTQPWY